MPWTQALLRQQEIDLELEDLARHLDEIHRAMEDQQSVKAARSRAQQRSAAADQARKAQETLEFELQRVETKRQEAEQRLYGGKVQNPRELSGLQAEVQSLQRRQRQLEDEILEAMANRETADTAARQATAECQQVETAAAGANTQLVAERDRLQARQAALQAEIARIQPQIPPAILDTYHHIRGRMGPRAVAKVQDGTCNLCGIELTGPTLRKARAEELAYCDGCGRLIVAD